MLTFPVSSRRRSAARLAITITALVLWGCAKGQVETIDEDGSGGSTVTSGGMGGTPSAGGSGGNSSSCLIDCTGIQTPQCQQAVCNEGDYPGPVGQCVVIPKPDDTSCDDGLFCTVNDSCQAGTCVGPDPNLCGNTPNDCEVVSCDEVAQDCSVAPVADGSSCTPTDLCQTGGTCTNGNCLGTPKDCFFAPVGPCETATCDPMTGMCVGMGDPLLDGQGCVDPADLCTVGKTCLTGMCQGGGPKDCSSLDIGCYNGVCDTATGMCMSQQVPQGMTCNTGTDQCNVGICDAMQVCVPNPVMNGTVCNDYSICTTGDVCTNGVCGGTPVANCSTYFYETFENGCPPAGWTLNPEWECGTPTAVGPSTAFAGMNVLGTDLDSTYENGMAYTSSYAQTPPIGLGTATSPSLLYYHYVDTEGSVYDGYNVKISTNGGSTFTVLTNPTPAYNLTIASEPAFGGHQQAAGWQPVIFDLTPYVGQQIILRFSFRSDGSVVYPGIYIDNIAVAEADGIPLSITTQSLPNPLVSYAYTANMAYAGGTPNAVWSLTGGTNYSWMSINPNTGVITGTPAMANLGAGTVTVHIEEPTNPNNYDDVTYNFNVQQALYFENFEGTCPNSWTLGGDWQCGTPTSGPNAAFSGNQLIATILGGNYNNGNQYSVTRASSPAINLTGTTAPQLTFKVWHYTETSFDGFNLKVSTNGGTSWVQVTTVTPTYPQNNGGQSCWAGSFQSWQQYSANLTSYVGQTVNLAFEFYSDSSVVYPGVYIDDVMVSD